MSLVILGLIFNIIGVSILVLVAIFDPSYQRVFGEDKWWKRYYWLGWRPIFKVRSPNEKSHWMIKPKHKVVRFGIIPPKYMWDIIGFIFVLIGFWLQLRFYLSI